MRKCMELAVYCRGRIRTNIKRQNEKLIQIRNKGKREQFLSDVLLAGREIGDCKEKMEGR